MRSIAISFVLLFSLSLASFGQQVNAATQLKNTVPIANGGLNNGATPSNGQVPIYDNATSKYVPGDPIVSGPDAPGVAPTKNPVQMGVVDGSGNVQRASGDTSGNQNVKVQGSVPVTGTLPSTPAVPVIVLSPRPVLSNAVANNPLLYRDAMRVYCYQNLCK